MTTEVPFTEVPLDPILGYFESFPLIFRWVNNQIIVDGPPHKAKSSDYESRAIKRAFKWVNNQILLDVWVDAEGAEGSTAVIVDYMLDR
jgi:hypothetical protein